MHAPVPTLAKEVKEDWVDAQMASILKGDTTRCLSLCITALEAPCVISHLASPAVHAQDLSQTLQTCLTRCTSTASQVVERLLDFAPSYATTLRRFGFVHNLPLLACPSDTLVAAAALVRDDDANADALVSNGYVATLCSRLDGLMVIRSEEAVRFLIKVVDVCPEAASELSEATRRTVLRALDGGGDSV